jgi:hypothetical protein
MLTLKILQQFENQIAKIQNRPASRVVIKNFPKEIENVKSMYNYQDNEILINNEMMFQTYDIELVGIVFHEGRHAFQWYQIKNPNLAIEEEDMLRIWEKEFLDYDQNLANENDSKYYLKSIEIDAVAYTDLNLRSMTKVGLEIIEEMKEFVKVRQTDILNKETIF